MTCWGNGSTCLDKNHEIHVVSRCPPELARKVQLTDPYCNTELRANFVRIFSLQDDIIGDWKRKQEDRRLEELKKLYSLPSKGPVDRHVRRGGFLGKFRVLNASSDEH
jgi:hypothetical protein